MRHKTDRPPWPREPPPIRAIKHKRQGGLASGGPSSRTSAGAACAVRPSGFCVAPAGVYPTHVIVEAFWVAPEKFDVLMKIYPHINSSIRNHSDFQVSNKPPWSWSIFVTLVSRSPARATNSSCLARFAVEFKADLDNL